MSHADRLSRRKMQVVLSMPHDISPVLEAGLYTHARKFVISSKVPVPAKSTTLNRLPIPNKWIVDDMDISPIVDGCPPAFPMCSGTQQRLNRVLRPVGTAEFAVDLHIRQTPQSLPYFSDLRSKVYHQKPYKDTRSPAPTKCMCLLTNRMLYPLPPVRT
jgi:hypothetical protein